THQRIESCLVTKLHAVVPSNGNDQIIHYLEETLDRLLSTEQLRRVLTPFQLDAKFNELQQQMSLALASNHDKTSLTVDQIHDMLRQTKRDIEKHVQSFN
ncbi:hypothetical protein CEXT_52151, partial [Caerostris extrusa]